jgi:hypothetical protein
MNLQRNVEERGPRFADHDTQAVAETLGWRRVFGLAAPACMNWTCRSERPATSTDPRICPGGRAISDLRGRTRVRRPPRLARATIRWWPALRQCLLAC